MDKLISAGATVLLLVALFGCGAAADEPEVRDQPTQIASAEPGATQSEADGDPKLPGPDTPADPPSPKATEAEPGAPAATLADGYPQEWIDLDIPAIQGARIEGNYLSEFDQIRVISRDGVLPDAVVERFTAALVAGGWEDVTSADKLEFLLESTELKETGEGELHILTVDVETALDVTATTFTVWRFTQKK